VGRAPLSFPLTQDLKGIESLNLLVHVHSLNPPSPIPLSLFPLPSHPPPPTQMDLTFSRQQRKPIFSHITLLVHVFIKNTTNERKFFNSYSKMTKLSFKKIRARKRGKAFKTRFSVPFHLAVLRCNTDIVH
jgi:hypothetical protein